MKTNFMDLILYKRSAENVQYALFILLGVLIGIIPLLDLPLKWTVSLIMAEGFVVILYLVKSLKRLLLFILALLFPLYIGTGLPAFFSIIDQIGRTSYIDLKLIDVIVMALLLYRLVRLATHQAEIRFFAFTTVPALAWIAASAVSVANAKDVGLTVIQLCEMGKLFLLYIVVANNIENEGDFNWLMAGLVVGILFEALLGTYQNITGKALSLFCSPASSHILHMETKQGMVTRVYGTLGHPNSYAMYLSAMVGFVLAPLYSRISAFGKALFSAVLSFAVLGIIMSLSRGGWLALVSVFLIVPVFAIRRRRQNLRIASVVGFVGFLIMLSLTLGERNLITTRIRSDDHGAAHSRVTQFKGAIAIIQEYPLLGVGLNNYALLMPELDPASVIAVGHPTSVHNIYLLIAAETGLIGLAAFVWLLASLFVQARQLASRAPNDTLWVAGVGVFSAYTALSLHGMVEFSMLYNPPIFRLFWLLAGIVAGLSTNAGYDRAGVQSLNDK